MVEKVGYEDRMSGFQQPRGWVSLEGEPVGYRARTIVLPPNEDVGVRKIFLLGDRVRTSIL